ncbi:MAG: DNA gyrase subunit A, partial [Firmicutes bacterium]|nr:DNA gyrase subunit A [Bacillota bacterium]
GELIGAMTVKEEDEVMLINSDGIIIRIKASDVSRLGRATQGVKIMKVGEETNIIAMAKAVTEEPSKVTATKSDDSVNDEEQTTLDV